MCKINNGFFFIYMMTMFCGKFEEMHVGDGESYISIWATMILKIRLEFMYTEGLI